MISIKTAQYAIICGLFILTFIFTSAVDLAITLSLSAYLLFFQKNFTITFILSGLMFVADILLRYFDINIRFISDVSVDAYILFLTAVYLYLKTRKDFLHIIKKIDIKQGTSVTKKTLYQAGISVMIVLLFFPIFGGIIAAIAGYFLFSYLRKHYDSRYAVIVALFFLMMAAIAFILGKNSLADGLVIYTYVFMIVSLLQEITKYITRSLGINAAGIVSSASVITLNPKIVHSFLVIVFLLILLFGYYLLSKSSVVSLTYIKGPPSKISVTPPISSASPSVTPGPSSVPTLIATPSAIPVGDLSVMVENGTEITGLAASTAAILKDKGFKNVKISNAEKTDYKTWEMYIKKQDDSFIRNVKKILSLTGLTVHQSTEGAQFDIQIIAGEKK